MRKKPVKPKRNEWTRIYSVNKRIENGKKCAICGKTLHRVCRGIRTNALGYKQEQWERLSAFNTRLVCSYFEDGIPENYVVGDRKRSKCWREYYKDERNQNSKGICPRCIDCGKRFNHYKKNKNGIGYIAVERCSPCFKKWAKETNFYANQPGALKIAEIGRKTKGIHPEKLKPYAFIKGRESWLKGKTFEDVYGKIKSEEVKRKIINSRFKHYDEWINNLIKSKNKNKIYGNYQPSSL